MAKNRRGGQGPLGAVVPKKKKNTINVHAYLPASSSYSSHLLVVA
jgi:hypothetical protein